MDDYADSNRTIYIVPTLHMYVHHTLVHVSSTYGVLEEYFYSMSHLHHHDVRPR